jgi:hypothetical protein
MSGNFRRPENFEVYLQISNVRERFQKIFAAGVVTDEQVSTGQEGKGVRGEGKL